MPDGFIYRALPTRVLFARGARRTAGDEAAALGMTRPLVISSPEQRDVAAQLVDDARLKDAIRYFEACMHTPVAVTETALARLRENRCDGLIAIGGGSAIGLSKALATRTDLPQLVLPTTYAGSEMTDILGETATGEKLTRRDPAIQPETVIYDVELTTSLPIGISMRSGMNAIAHAVEGLYAHDSGPVSDLMAARAVELLVGTLPEIAENGGNLAAREGALLGAHLAGCVLGMVSMALHHKLCHVLGGTFGLPHAPTHSVILPYSIAYNLHAAADRLRPLRASIGEDIAGALQDFARSIGIDETLGDLGLDRAHIERAAQLATEKSYPNPARIEEPRLQTLLNLAWAGERPVL